MRTRLAAGSALLLAIVLLSGCAGSPNDGSSTATTSPSSSSSPTPSASPTATPVAATCANIATPELRKMMADQNWVSWTLPRNGVGNSPFAKFPGGAPEGQISCRWGKDPDLATDNILDQAWAPITGVAATAAEEYLESHGYVRVPATEGVYLELKDDQVSGGSEDAREAFLFTADDVRWAPRKSEIAYIQAPDDAN